MPLPPSPDDAAPAPLAQAAEQVRQREALGRSVPDLYIPLEPISQEPDWDDLGGLSSAAPPSAHSRSAEPPAVPAAAVNAAPLPPPPRRGEAQSAAAPAGDVRAHPNYLEVTRLFSGRVKEIGKVKKVVADAAQDGTEGPDELEETVDGAAEA